MPTLELVDALTDEPLGSTATLENGKIIFDGDGIKQIGQNVLADHPAPKAFKRLMNWTNGYFLIRLKR